MSQLSRQALAVVVAVLVTTAMFLAANTAVIADCVNGHCR